VAQLAVLSSSKRLLADAGAPAVLAPAPDAAMLADAGAPAVLGNAYGSQWDFAKAIEYHTQDLAIAKEVEDRGHGVR